MNDSNTPEAPQLPNSDLQEKRWLAERVRKGMEILRAAHSYTERAGSFEFAVSVSELRQAGLAAVDLQWLMSRGLVIHLYEFPGASQSRKFQKAQRLVRESSCFLLTESGFAFSRQLSTTDHSFQETPGNFTQSEQPVSPTSSHSSNTSDLKPQTMDEGDGVISIQIQRNESVALSRSAVKPFWDVDRQELWIGEHLVKRYRAPSPNQIAILSAFEEENWPSRIDDPLPPKLDQDPKRRLHDTIRNLNRVHSIPLIKFVGDGTGFGVLWEFVERVAVPSLSNRAAR